LKLTIHAPLKGVFVETKKQIAAIVPARYASTRFPGKPLVRIDGKTMIERVYEQASKCSLVGDVLVATDDERIADAVRAFGGKVMMTRADHPTGTDRLAEVAVACPQYQIIVNVQGDEPLIDPQAVDNAIQALIDEPAAQMSTLCARLLKQSEVESPNCVKVVRDQEGYALYFSREPVPHYRDGRPFDEREYYLHVGLYVYRRDCLLKLAKLQPTPLEKAESLEQLRALENGIRIRVIESTYRAVGVDVPEDVAKVEATIQQVHL
jgi:3-deoxy-manno-octulosonate cytidylyltransferase (CMP-KDO synthetase)